jgi:hypothetical protein
MLIDTIDGPRDDAELRRVDGVVDNENEFTRWVEFYDGERLVHRSAHVTLKEVGVIAEALAASLA